MKIVNVIGGLGNQMFQCAFAIALQKVYTDEAVKLDISHFNGYGLHNGYEVTEIFHHYPIPVADRSELRSVSRYIPNYKLSRAVRRYLPKRKTEYLQSYRQSYIYDATTLKGNDGYHYYEGYWMCPAYFDFCKEDVIEAYTFPEFDTDENKEYARLLEMNNSVTIHVRRGDYVGAESFKDICTLTYYKNAIREAKTVIDKPVFFIFSNDPQWCKENLGELFGDDKVMFVGNNKGKESYRDMQLMALARCNILANSSFSWWGAYLNKRADQVVCCPEKWVNNMEHKDHYVKGWIKIPIQ